MTARCSSRRSTAPIASRLMYLRLTRHSSVCSARRAPTRRTIEASFGKIPTTLDRRLIFLFKRSSVFVDASCGQCSLGNPMKARTSSSASSPLRQHRLPLNSPLRQHRFPLNRYTAEGTEYDAWQDIRRPSRPKRWRGCCRLRAQRRKTSLEHSACDPTPCRGGGRRH